MNYLFLCRLGIFLILLSGCATKTVEEKNDTSTITKTAFGKTPEGQDVQLFTLKNKNRIEVGIINYGGIVTSIITPDKEGNMGDIVLGFDNFEGYLTEHPFFGALVGRYANRIGGAAFTLNGVEYNLAKNDGGINHLHGGIKGFDKVVWEAEEIESEEGAALKLTYLSKDGEEGYPGNLAVAVTYTLTADDELNIDYQAETDKATPVNLTNHSYFNLAAGKNVNVLEHVLEIAADTYNVVDSLLIPTGELRPVKGTGMDFTSPNEIGEKIEQVGGYDHNYILDKTTEDLEFAARVLEPESGRMLEVFTTKPGIQLYTGNWLNGTITGKGGVVYKKHFGFCLETQFFPDSPNKPEFPSTILNPGEKYHHVTVYKFGVK